MTDGGARTALVTGGTGGMGRVIAGTLAADGFDVAVAYVGSIDLADATVGEIKDRGAAARRSRRTSPTPTRPLRRGRPRPVIVCCCSNAATPYDRRDRPFRPELHYYVGGNSKVFGAALFRLPPGDFGEVRHPAGISPAWPRRALEQGLRPPAGAA
jgi:choline dehydrogenase-like flavoprotein